MPFVVPVPVVTTSKIIYTKRRNGKEPELLGPSTAAFNTTDLPPYEEVLDKEAIIVDEKEERSSSVGSAISSTNSDSRSTVSDTTSTTSISTGSSNSSTDKLQDRPPHVSHDIQVFPQYMSRRPMKVTLEEKGLPHGHGNFTAIDDAGNELFFIKSEHFSLSDRQHVYDSATEDEVFTIRADVGTLPKSFHFECPNGNHFLELRGEFFAPYTSPKASGYLDNRASGKREQLAMKGSWKNKRATIINKESQEVVAKVTSDIWTAKNVFSGRRTYEVDIAAGIDYAVVIGMVVGLDKRSQGTAAFHFGLR